MPKLKEYILIIRYHLPQKGSKVNNFANDTQLFSGMD